MTLLAFSPRVVEKEIAFPPLQLSSMLRKSRFFFGDADERAALRFFSIAMALTTLRTEAVASFSLPEEVPFPLNLVL